MKTLKSALLLVMPLLLSVCLVGCEPQGTIRERGC